MEEKDLISLYYERSNQMNTLWSVYITVALGLITFLAHEKPFGSKAFLPLILITVGYLVFAYVNLDAMVDIARARLALQQLIYDPSILSAMPVEQERQRQILLMLRLSIAPPTIRRTVFFHCLGTLGVLVFIWALALRHGSLLDF